MNSSLIDPAGLPFRRILLVSPHADDESLGCGGLIWHLARLGRTFHVVFVTDGGASHPNSFAWPRERLAAEREKEAGEALRLLGLGQAARTFLGLRDADMPADGAPEQERALGVVTDILKEFRPDLALLPWRRDPHRDHRDSWRLFMRAFELTSRRPEILEYAIWMDEIGAPGDRPETNEMERLDFDVAEAVGAKRAAVEAHRTQASDMIDDDPSGFRLTAFTIDRLVGGVESYWRELP